MKKSLGILLLLPMCAAAQHGIFINGEVGYASHTDIPSVQTLGASSKSNKNIPAWDIRVGYLYQLRKHFGLGVSMGHGEYGHTNFKYGADAQKASYYANEFLFHIDGLWSKVDMRFEVGGIRSGVRYSGAVLHSTQVRQQFLWGLQGIYALTAHQGLSLAYRRSRGSKAPKTQVMGQFNPGLNAVMLGWQYTFF